MPRPNRKPSERKVKVSAKARVRKKNDVKKDALQKAPFIMNDNGLNMRIKIKRKSQ